MNREREERDREDEERDGGERAAAAGLLLKRNDRMDLHTPPNLCTNFLLVILRYMRNLHHDTPDFLSKKDSEFRNVYIGNYD